MKKTNTLITMMILIAAILGVSCSYFKANDPPNAVKEGISMLEAKEYEKFLDRFMPPEEKAKMLSENKQKFVDGFSANQAGEVLTVFKKIKDRQPEYNEDKTVATYKLDGDNDLKTKRPLIFKKMNDVWYISN